MIWLLVALVVAAGLVGTASLLAAVGWWRRVVARRQARRRGGYVHVPGGTHDYSGVRDASW